MSHEQQIRQLKDAIAASELMSIEQSRFIVRLSEESETLRAEIAQAEATHASEIARLNELSEKKQKELNAQVEQISQELQVNYTCGWLVALNEKQQVINEKSEMEVLHGQQVCDLNSVISELEQLLVEAKMQIAQKSGEVDSQGSECTSSEKSYSSDPGDSHSTTSTTTTKSICAEADDSFRNAAILHNKELLKNLSAASFSKLHFIKKELSFSKRVLINDSDSNARSNDFFFGSSLTIGDDTSTPSNISNGSVPLQKQASLEKYCDNLVGQNVLKILLQQTSPQVMMLNDKEAHQVGKVLVEENDMKANAVRLKLYHSEVSPIIESKLFLYSDLKCQAIQEKVLTLLKKNTIPSLLRKTIWPKLIGNKLRITKKIYKNLEEQMALTPLPLRVSNLIREDMHRTYPNMSLFDKGSQTNDTLQSILEQFHYFRPDIGYVQGMAYPAAVLFLNLGDSYHTFKYLNNLIAGNQFLSNLYKFKIDQIRLYVSVFDYFLGQKHPNVIKHLRKHSIQSDIFLVEWFFTLFCRAFSFSLVAKIWDMMLSQGEVVFFNVGIAIFSCIDKQLLLKDFDDTLFLIRSCTNKIEPDQLLKHINSSKLTSELLHKRYARVLEESAKKARSTTPNSLLTQQQQSPLQLSQQQQQQQIQSISSPPSIASPTIDYMGTPPQLSTPSPPQKVQQQQQIDTNHNLGTSTDESSSSGSDSKQNHSS